MTNTESYTGSVSSLLLVVVVLLMAAAGAKAAQARTMADAGSEIEVAVRDAVGVAAAWYVRTVLPHSTSRARSRSQLWHSTFDTPRTPSNADDDDAAAADGDGGAACVAAGDGSERQPPCSRRRALRLRGGVSSAGAASLRFVGRRAGAAAAASGGGSSGGGGDGDCMIMLAWSPESTWQLKLLEVRAREDD